MNQFFELLAQYNDEINTFVWTTLGLVLLLFTGFLTTVITKVFQVSHFGLWWKNTIGSLFKKDVISHSTDKSISPFQALCTALAATIGVGNIAGVAAAIAGLVKVIDDNIVTEEEARESIDKLAGLVRFFGCGLRLF